MKKYKVAVMAFILGAAPLVVRAQSPWESGSFKGYDSASAPSVPSGGDTGLQGFSLAPSTEDAAPAAPYVAPAPQLQLAAPAQPAATAPQTETAAPISPSVAAKDMMGLVHDTTFITLSQKSLADLVQSSQLAQKNATSDMQSFADQIVSIYGGMQTELAALAQKNNISAAANLKLPSSVDRLKNLSGVDFNKQYMQIQMSQFYMLDSAFKKEAEDGQNEALKAYASSHLSMLDDQKTMVQKSYMSLIGQNSATGFGR